MLGLTVLISPQVVLFAVQSCRSCIVRLQQTKTATGREIQSSWGPFALRCGLADKIAAPSKTPAAEPSTFFRLLRPLLSSLLWTLGSSSAQGSRRCGDGAPQPLSARLPFCACQACACQACACLCLQVDWPEQPTPPLTHPLPAAKLMLACGISHPPSDALFPFSHSPSFVLLVPAFLLHDP